MFKVYFALFLLCITVPINVRGQIDSTNARFPMKDGHVVYEDIEQVKNLSQAKIYAASKKWIVDYFASAKAVIQTEDKEAGSLVGVAYTDLPQSSVWANMVNMKIKFSFHISCKDDKYRIRLYNLAIVSSDGIGGQNTIQFEQLVKANGTSKLNAKKQAKYDAAVNQINDKFTQVMLSLSKAVHNNIDDF